jgi:ATP:ADP antiporter, AAA family
MSWAEALALLRGSRHLQIIALVISFAAVGAAIIEQQLNMAAEAAKGGQQTDAITVFLAQVQLWTSAIGFIVQVWVTSRVHRFLGIGFALMILPVSLGASAVVMLLNAALWAPGLARVLDQSLRYTIDKTTREVLFLPLPGDVTLKAKAFVDVTVDRLAKACAALLLLVLVQPWGLNLDWQQLSYASLAMMALWIAMAIRARRGYLQAFRRSIERRDVVPAEVRLSGADLSTIETLVQEFAHPSPARVVYAIDMLEALGKGTVVTPLLLHHESALVRERTLHAIAATHSAIAAQWTPQIRRTLADPEATVRAAALVALGAIARDDVPTLARPLLDDPDPRIRVTAAVALASSSDPADLDVAATKLSAMIQDLTDAAQPVRHDVAAALAHTHGTRFRHLLIPLLHDPSGAVADQAMASVRRMGTADFVFVPTLVSLLRDRQLKGRAREVLVSYGEPIIDTLATFMADPLEDIWVRRHLPSTLAMIPSQKTVDVLMRQLNDPDGFLRYKVTYALTRLRRVDAHLQFPVDDVQRTIVQEARRFFLYQSLHHNLNSAGAIGDDDLLGLALMQKTRRGQDRIFQLLGLIHQPDDIAAAEWTLSKGDARGRASASEYLDNLLTGLTRKFVMPIAEDMPPEERVRQGNVLIGSRPRDVEETLLQLMNDDDQVIAACAIALVGDQQRWALVPDICHVREHRQARDRFVLEAAGWALARRESLAGRRETGVAGLPVVVQASHMRALPLFASLSVEELFRFAASARQMRHEPETTLIMERVVPDMLHVLIDGHVVLTDRTGRSETVAAPATFGFPEVLLSRPMASRVRATEVAVTLALTSDELLTQLAYNAELVRGLFATMTRPEADDARPPVASSGAAREFAQFATEGVLPIEKVLALENVPLFSHLSAEETMHVAGITHVQPLHEGQTMFRATDPPAVWLVLAGEARLEPTDALPGATITGGDIVGALSALAGPRVGRDATMTRSGVALRIERDDLFEVLSDRPEMLRQLFAAVMEDAASQETPDTAQALTLPAPAP